MQLAPDQVSGYFRDGFLVLPALYCAAEVAVLQAETQRLSEVMSDCVKRERSGAARSILRVHETDGETASAAFRALTRTPRLVQPVTQLLGDDQVYIFHTKINVKAAFEGGIYSWHQDFGTWRSDGLRAPLPITAMVMLDDATELAGCLYFAPGSHQDGDVAHEEDHALGALNRLSADRRQQTRVLEARRPVPIVGVAGTVVLFHSNLVHGSGHNMSPWDRRQIYVVYNPVANKPSAVESPRPDFVCSRNCMAIEMVSDADILSTVGGSTAGKAPLTLGAACD